MNEEPVKRCPECRCKVRRLLGVGAGIIFKGSGFYETDYKRKESSGKEKTSAEQKTSDKNESGSAKKGQETAAPEKN
jgi:predicted nucleic acid-binding Zn ribbon protein